MRNVTVAVTNAKIRYLVDATEAYILEHDIDKEVRFDVIGVVENNGEWDMEHIEEAFYPPICQYMDDEYKENEEAPNRFLCER